ncbi:hypothetical protein CGZ98_06170 [Enemella evansiae]|uniref:hypothetical protein n=1 Tax=Enemella evansiae TaxID=2016499 RepID=UPI000B96AB0E|nr:hypothetical protein [Enemella evansiae]OYO13127.1 hypothetical protein CGZ98_06170 [Enemella evansiae]
MDMSQAERLLRADVDARLAALQAYQQASDERQRAEAALTDATAAEATAWAELETAGWTAAQLRQLGVTRPGSKPRPRRRSKSAKPEQTGSKPQASTAAPAAATSSDAPPAPQS